MKSWKCELCGKQISELGSYAKLTSSKYAHLTCFSESEHTERFIAGQRSLLEEQAEAQEALKRAAQEQERAKAAALETERLNKQRIANLTQAAREALKREMQGEATERFALVEVATPEEMAAQEAARQAEQDRLKARQEADAKKIPKCVRCGVPTNSQEHPGHCEKCWNVDPKKPIQQDLESDIKEALKRGVRPLELE